MLDVSSEVATYSYGSQQLATDRQRVARLSIGRDQIFGWCFRLSATVGRSDRYRGESSCLTASALVIDQLLLDPSREPCAHVTARSKPWLRVISRSRSPLPAGSSWMSLPQKDPRSTPPFNLVNGRDFICHEVDKLRQRVFTKLHLHTSSMTSQTSLQNLPRAG